MGGLLHLVQRGGDWAGPVPITVLLHNDPLLCGFNVPIKGLKSLRLRDLWADVDETLHV